MKKWVGLLLGVSNLCTCYAQYEKIEVNKLPVRDSKFYIQLRYEKDAFVLESNGNRLDGFEKLHDSVKLIFVKNLLQFKNDTSLSIQKPSPSFITNDARLDLFKTPRSTFQTLQVNALYRINRLVYGSLTDYVSPAPVLYDTLLKKEVNNDQKIIAGMFKLYQKWYKRAVLKGKISKYFPFNNGRYIWFHGKRPEELDDFLSDYKKP